MASLILLFSELVQNHEWDPEALIASYSVISSCASAAAATNQRQNSSEEQKEVKEDPLESRICVDFV